VKEKNKIHKNRISQTAHTKTKQVVYLPKELKNNAA
jgi:hypothetical protein